MVEEKVDCDLCGSKAYVCVFEKLGFNVVRCSECGLVYVNPRPKYSETKSKYNAGELSPIEYYAGTERADKRTFKERLRIASRYCKTGSMLDVGCNVGTLLEVGKENGWDGLGVDVNQDAVKVCLKKGLRAKFMDIELFKTKERFELIVMSDLIEHVNSPTKTLSLCRKLLNKDGCLMISTPDYGSLLSKSMGARWFHIKPDEHIYYFDKATIRVLLKKAGFRVVYLKHNQRYRDLNSIVKYLPLPKRMRSSISGLLKSGIKLYLNDELLVVAKKN